MNYFTLLTILLSFPLNILHGIVFLRCIIRIYNLTRLTKNLTFEIEHISLICFYSLGLLFYLTIVFCLTCLKVPLLYSSLIAYLPALIAVPDLKKIFNSVSLNLSLNFIIWFSLHLFIGSSLFSAQDSISTPWLNNYGDLAWHLGIVNSFNWGNNFPPQNHIFPGENLSYAFFVNLWTSTFWSIEPNLKILPTIFTFQWLIIWSLIFFLLNGNKLKLLPWAVLFGGGTYNFANTCFNNFLNTNYSFISTKCTYKLDFFGDPWSPFLTTIWVPQRSTLLGLLVFLAAIKLFLNFQRENNKEKKAVSLIASGAILSLSILAHTHFFLTVVTFCFLMLGFNLIPKCSRESFSYLVKFSISLLPSMIFLPWIINKTGIISFSGAWMQQENLKNFGFLTVLYNSLFFWERNSLPWLFSVLIALFVLKSKKEIFAIAVLFILANLFQVAVWDWDQLKIFLTIYLITIVLWTSTISSRTIITHYAIFPFLIIPGLLEFIFNFFPINKYEIYNAADIKKAQTINSLTSENDIIAAAPNHNSLITLSGRKLYFGYLGTLNSQGVDYKEREIIQNSLENIINCKKNFPSSTCPDYILWTEQEKKFWKSNLPVSRLQATSLDYLYKIPNQL